MIISASRRTDIPAYYSDWFMNRIREGYVYVRNPVSERQISKISLSPDVIDGIVFWTKNPTPMLSKLDGFTLNSYGSDVEKRLPSKNSILIPTFQRLSDLISPDRVIWRYDPIFLSDAYSMEYHIHYFKKLAKLLAPYTRQCTISFLDLYPRVQKNIADLNPKPFSLDQQDELAKNIAEIAHSYRLSVATCAEGIDLARYGIEHARCIDDRLFERLTHRPMRVTKDKNQRLECGCVESVDIGAYNTCLNGCAYCYANYSEQTVRSNSQNHNPNSPLLIGEAQPDDKITERKLVSHQENQLRLDLQE